MSRHIWLRLRAGMKNRWFSTERPKIRPPEYDNSTKKSEAGKWLLLTVPVTTFCLGSWQVKRRTWKNELIENINSKMSSKPEPLPEKIIENKLGDYEYKRFVVRGIFNHEKELFIQPRTLVTAKETEGGSLISTGPRVGAYVVTPLYMPDRGYSILINRGFVDKNHVNAATRQAGQVEGEVEITGVFRLAEKSKMMPKNRPEQNLWGSISINEMAYLTDCRPIFLDATAESTVPDGPIGGQTRIRLWNQHVSYIITWYSLSALTAVMWFTKYVR